MYKQHQHIEAALRDVDQYDLSRQDYVGDLSDLALKNTMRFSQDFDGEYGAKAIPSPPIEGARYTFSEELPPHDPRFVHTYDDGHGGSNTYVDRETANIYALTLRDYSKVAGLRDIFGAVEGWCPEEFIAHDRDGQRLGIDIRALSKVAEIVEHRPQSEHTIGGAKPGGALHVSTQAKEIFRAYSKAVLTPPETTK